MATEPEDHADAVVATPTLQGHVLWLTALRWHVGMDAPASGVERPVPGWDRSSAPGV
jgi:hypothetical protein